MGKLTQGELICLLQNLNILHGKAEAFLLYEGELSYIRKHLDDNFLKTFAGPFVTRFRRIRHLGYGSKF